MSASGKTKQLAVVFVHGLFSDASAWSAMAQLVASDPGLAQFTTYQFEYPTPIHIFIRKDRSIPTLEVVADRLATYLRTSVQEPEVALVTHSQGGLVALHMIDNYYLGGIPGDNIPALRSLTLFACPHAGSQFGWRTRRTWSTIFGAHPQEASLKPLDPGTARSIRRVVNAANDKTVRGNPTFVAVVGDSDNVVVPASASGAWRQIETVAGDHSSLIRPASANTDNYKVLRNQLITSLAAPGLDLPARPLAADPFWTELVDDVAKKAHFKDWDWAVGGLARTTYGLRESVLQDLFQFCAWVQGRIYPRGNDLVVSALNNFATVVVDLLNTFGKHTDALHPESNDPFIRVHRWQDAGGYNKNYDRDAHRYDVHVSLLTDLLFEATRAAQWFCDVVRSELDPSFRLKEGALQLEVGPFMNGNTEIIKPEYSKTERLMPSPYPGLEAFKSVRYTRDHSTNAPDEVAARLLDSDLELALQRFGPGSWSPFGDSNGPELVFRAVYAEPAPVDLDATPIHQLSPTQNEDREKAVRSIVENSSLTAALRGDLHDSWNWTGEGAWALQGGSGGPHVNRLSFEVDWPDGHRVRQPFACQVSVLTGPGVHRPDVLATVVAVDFGISLIELNDARTPSDTAYRTTPPPAPAALSIPETVETLRTLVSSALELGHQMRSQLTPGTSTTTCKVGTWIRLNGVEVERVIDLRGLPRLQNPTTVAAQHLIRTKPSDSDPADFSQRVSADLLRELLSQSDFRNLDAALDESSHRG